MYVELKCESINGMKVAIRAPEPKNAEPALRLLQEPSLHPDFMAGPPPQDLSSYTDLVKRAENDMSRIAGWIYADDVFVGIVGIWQIYQSKFTNMKYGYLYYAIVPSRRGLGIATAAARTVVNYCFKHEGFSRIGAVVLEQNAASQRVLEKLGFRFHETVKEGYEEDDVLYDCLAYRLDRPV